jgi:hypothetical protein
MMVRLAFVLLALLELVCGNSQLQQLINFARGQGQPPPGRPTGSLPVKPAPAPQQPVAFIPAPIPFAGTYIISGSLTFNLNCDQKL